MNIWDWVNRLQHELAEAGHTRVAQLIDSVPSATCDGNHSDVEAMVPEGVAAARALKQPWLEVFFRHWLMQSRVLHRYDAHYGTGQAVELLEFATRPETRDCPQSVCVTQDLAACYSIVDGEGFVPERLAAASETLERIDPSWACWDCISAEYAGALIDDGQYEEAIAYCKKQQRLAQPHGGIRGSGVAACLTDALTDAGKYKEALTSLNAWRDHDEESTQREWRVARARCLVMLNRADEAAEVLPALNTIDPELYIDWVRVCAELCKREVMDNSWQLGAALRKMQTKLTAHGAFGIVAHLHVYGAELALGRGQRHMAERHRTAADAVLEKLRRPELFRSKFDALFKTAPAAALPELAETAQAVLDGLGDDPEADLPVLSRACERWPEQAEVATVLARALRATGWPDAAEHELRAAFERSESPEVLRELANSLMAQGRHDDLDALLDRHGDGLGHLAARFRARSLKMRGDMEGATQVLTEYVEKHDDDDSALRELARIHRDEGRHDAALELLDVVVGRNEPGPDDWDRMISATIIGDWVKVRASAERVEYDIESDEGPIDEPRGLIRVRGRDDRGAEVTDVALATGPVTARVLSFATPGETERYGDTVVFDPDPSVYADEQPDDDDEDGAPVLFPTVTVLDHARRKTYIFDGVHPGEEAVQALRDGLFEASGTILSVRSDESYQLFIDDEPSTGIYAYVSHPSDATPAEVHKLLTDLTKDWPKPPTWPDLAKAAGDSAAEQRHHELAEEYGL